ncbi:MAG: hypothetical protein ACYDBV_11140 [Nitrospiria bacterium]
MITYNQINIDLKSPTYDVSIIPQQLKNNHRFLLKIAHLRYISDVDLTFNIYYKQLYTEVESLLTFTVSHLNNYFKQKLPPAILCREFRWEISGSLATNVIIYECGLMWQPLNIGDR